MKTTLVAMIAGSLVTCALGFLVAGDSWHELSELQAFLDDATVNVDIQGASYSHEIVMVGKEQSRPASIVAGGAIYLLDVRHNRAAERELIRTSVLTHGDARVQKVNVQGSLEFRPIVKGRPDSGVRPVIVVKTLKVTLEQPGVHPRSISIDEPLPAGKDD